MNSPYIDHVEIEENGAQRIVLTEAGREALTLSPEATKAFLSVGVYYGPDGAPPRRPRCSLFQKWRLCRNRLAWAEQKVCEWRQYHDGQFRSFGSYLSGSDRRNHSAEQKAARLAEAKERAGKAAGQERRHQRAAERYRRMLWGRKPFRSKA